MGILFHFCAPRLQFLKAVHAIHRVYKEDCGYALVKRFDQ